MVTLQNFKEHNMKTQLKLNCLTLALLVFCIALSGCGSGGSSAPNRTTKIKTSMKTAGLTTGYVPAGYVVGTLDLVLSIPYGVTVELDPLTNQPVKSVLQLVGTTDPAMTLNTLDYVAPTSTVPGTLRISYVAAAGFTPSDSISVTLDIANGISPSTSDFSLTKYDIGVVKFDPITSTVLDSQNISIPNPNSLLTVSIT
jgi:hypothetical protein